jgi:Sec7-like guanine-nucleotide exchange factor
MNNNTKIRLRLSKNLFESLTREILAEAKVNGGGAYTEVVKMPKVGKIKEVNAVADTDKMEKMEEKMSSKEKMAKGLYNEVDVDTDKMEEAPVAKPKHDVEALKKAKAKLEQRISEMETMTAEDKIEESVKKRKLKK